MVWAIGDIQGCFKPFMNLLKRVDFNPKKDQLWIAGDMVNRGDNSLEVLEYIYSIQDSVKVVLGNHDIALISSYLGVRKPPPSLEPILNHKRAKEWVEWLREQPFAVYDDELNIFMAHAGLAPIFDEKIALEWSRTLQKKLKSSDAKSWLKEAKNSKATRLSFEENSQLYALESFIRMRYCYEDGSLDFEQKGEPTKELQKKGLLPWFEIKSRKETSAKIIFGHWSTLGYFENSSVCCLDSGCLWGRDLTIRRLDGKKRKIEQISCPSC